MIDRPAFAELRELLLAPFTEATQYTSLKEVYGGFDKENLNVLQLLINLEHAQGLPRVNVCDIGVQPEH
jgi:hypothetical protein